MLGLYHLLSSGWGLTVDLQYCCGLDFVPSMYYSRLVYDIDNLLDDRDNFFSSSFEDEMKKRYPDYTPKTKRSEVCSSAIKVLVSLCNCDVDLFYVAMNEPQAFVMDLIQNAMTNRNKDLYGDSRYTMLCTTTVRGFVSTSPILVFLIRLLKSDEVMPLALFRSIWRTL